MPHTRRASLVLALAAVACKGPAEPREVRYNWKPAQAESVAGVSGAALAQAIATQLADSMPAGVTGEQWEHVRKLYQSYQGAPLWMESKGPNETRTNALLAALADAHSDALRLEEYPIAALVEAVRAARETKPATAEGLARADVLLSSTYLALAEDLMSGQTDPKNVTNAWYINPRHERLDSAAVHSLQAEDLQAGIARMRPQDPEYEALRQSLAMLRAVVDSGGWPQVPEGPSLNRGATASAERLNALRARLRAEGFDAGADAAVAATPGDSAAPRAAAGGTRAPYDRTLANAVAAWQARHGIPSDGVLGGETVKAMNLPAEFRLGQVAASLERHRWMPRNLGERYIYVNIPAFYLRAVDTAGTNLEMRVIVGAEYEGRTTPVFADSMETVVFRPYWNVTPDIQRKEIEPLVAADPSYLARNNMEYWNDGGTQRIRQLPGPKNSLGLVKFLFPNSYNIYLHDTPARLLFLKDMRAFSHGCIRVHKPDELAQWVLGWDPARVEAAMEDGGNNRSVRLPKKIPVYITYFTAYIHEGQLHFGNDLYSRDEDLIAAMQSGARTTPETAQQVSALKALAEED